jgi:hypothetical protein
MLKKTVLWCALAALGVVGLSQGVQAAPVNTQVGLELALLMDVSGSVDATEFNLQRQGYVNAFQSAAVQNAITGGQLGSIAVTVMYWSGGVEQQQAVGWTLIDSAASANAFAAAIAGTTRPYTGQTAPGSAINAIISGNPTFTTFATNTFDGLRQVIDVSGDGAENNGANTIAARNAALAAGIDQINGLAIGDASLLAWYNTNIKGGTGSFVHTAATFGDFSRAIEEKIIAEVSNTPVGAPTPGVAMAGLMLIGGLGMSRRRATTASTASASA